MVIIYNIIGFPLTESGTKSIDGWNGQFISYGEHMSYEEACEKWEDLNNCYDEVLEPIGADDVKCVQLSWEAAQLYEDGSESVVDIVDSWDAWNEWLHEDEEGYIDPYAPVPEYEKEVR